MPLSPERGLPLRRDCIWQRRGIAALLLKSNFKGYNRLDKWRLPLPPSLRWQLCRLLEHGIHRGLFIYCLSLYFDWWESGRGGRRVTETCMGWADRGSGRGYAWNRVCRLCLRPICLAELQMCFLFTCLCMPQLLIVFPCHLSPLSLPSAGVLATISAHLYGIILDLFFPRVSSLCMDSYYVCVCV